MGGGISGLGQCTDPNGKCDGLGHGNGKLPPKHEVKGPSMREPGATVNGRLAPELIQREVRAHFGVYRLCYENGTRGNPNLQGRVAVKFIIDRTGAVQTAVDGGSDLPDQSVVQCVVRGFQALSFPPPQDGMVTVVYPIVFSPASD
jgi:hypothetical protein